ncbi:JmjC domain-containing protein [Vibrio harveyi]|uniref:JmjC domain-containing protein n=1 Tax=Vibrio harveyi TaxID=669 RepID=UPI0018F1E44A|nr:cupin domain-containing protein [Vibrio harveyi]
MKINITHLDSISKNRDSIHFGEIIGCELKSTIRSRLFRLLESDLLDYPRIRFCGEGIPLSKGFKGFVDYKIQGHNGVVPQLNIRMINRLLGDGNTMIIDRCQHFFPEIFELCKKIESVFFEKVNANLYYSTNKNPSFGLHFDSIDGIAYQVLGEKNWVVYEPTVQKPTKHQKSFLFNKPSGKPLLEKTINEGEFIYIPNGFWHNVETAKSPSILISFSINTKKIYELIQEMSDNMHIYPELRESITSLNNDSDIKKVLSVLAEALSASRITEEISRNKSKFGQNYETAK